jgi:hypothetical protein
MNSLIHCLLDVIEIKTKIMCHNDPNISDNLREWQDGKLPDSYFKEMLNKYIDQLNGEYSE